jgi:Ca2+-binding RTX toxin-like protein
MADTWEISVKKSHGLKDLHELVATFIPASETVITVFGDDDPNRLVGGEIANGIDAGGGDDFVLGRGDHDLLVGGAGDDMLIGGEGNDLFNGLTGDDRLVGGGGFDTASYLSGGASVHVNLQTGVVTGDASVGTDKLSSIEGVIGSGFDDTIIGSSRNDVIAAAGGDDVIEGGNGDDIILGDEGDDILIGGAGIDFLEGGAGADVIQGGDLRGRHSGDDVALYSLSSAGVTVDLQNDIATGGDATGDTLINIGSLVGSWHADTLSGDAGANELDGLRGDDVLDGRGGRDVLIGGDGNDQLIGGTGDDELAGDDGDDMLDGGADEDKLAGGLGQDTLLGGDGDDTLTGGLSTDTLTGGAGDDLYVFANGEAQGDVITDFTAGGTEDAIKLSGYAGLNSFADLSGSLLQVGADVVVQLDADDSLLLQDTTVASLTANDFLFV